MVHEKCEIIFGTLSKCSILQSNYCDRTSCRYFTLQKAIATSDREERHDFKSRLWSFFSPFLFPTKKREESRLVTDIFTLLPLRARKNNNYRLKESN